MSYGTFKPIKKMRELKEGDIIRHASGEGMAYVVTGNYGEHVTAVRTIDITNPLEWLVFEKNTNPIIR